MTTTTQTPPTASHADIEAAQRAEIVEALHKHRALFRVTVAGLSDERPASPPR